MKTDPRVEACFALSFADLVTNKEFRLFLIKSYLSVFASYLLNMNY